jgi:hypothetical protein
MKFVVEIRERSERPRVLEVVIEHDEQLAPGLGNPV